MHNRAKPYLLAALPAVPYLVGVGFQVSGVTNIPLAVGIFEVAALLAAAVTWSLLGEWRLTAIVAGHRGTVLNRVRNWDGLKIHRLCVLRTELFAACLIFLACNATIYGFVRLAEHREQQSHQVSSNAPQLQKFYAELGDMFYAKVPKDISEADYDKWEKEEVYAKIDAMFAWVYFNMGKAAQYRLTDTHATRNIVQWPTAANARHNLTMNHIYKIQENLQAIIESTAWDGHGEPRSN